jgi:hypothetical protein
LTKEARGLPGVRERGRADLWTDTLTLKGGLPEGYYFPRPGNLVFFHAADSTPAFALRDVYSADGRAFTLDDTFAGLDPRAVAEGAAYAQELLHAALTTDCSMLGVKSEQRPKARFKLWSQQFRTMKFDPFSPSVTPDLPVSGALLSVRNEKDLPLLGDVVNAYTALTDARAVARVYGIAEPKPLLASHAFRLAEDQATLDHIIDAGDREAAFSSNVTRAASQRRSPPLPSWPTPATCWTESAKAGCGNSD